VRQTPGDPRANRSKEVQIRPFLDLVALRSQSGRGQPRRLALANSRAVTAGDGWDRGKNTAHLYDPLLVGCTII
jgi:hypothetical protein